MKDRLATLAGALLSLVLVTILLFPQEPPSPPVSRPTSADRGELGLKGLERWLGLNGVPTLSLRRRYSELDLQPGISPTGNLLITSIPHSYASDSLELEALLTWLDQGNRILVLAAVNDLPDWAFEDLENDDDSLLQALGFELGPPESEDEADNRDEEEDAASGRAGLLAAIEAAREVLQDLRRKELKLRPVAAYPLLAGIDEVATRATALLAEDGRRLEGAPNPRLARPLLVDPATGHEAFWVVRSGNATAWISSYPDLFGNRTLGEADNARLLQNLLNAALGPGGAVIFDDLHQGLSNLYDPEAFFSDERLWNSLWLLFLFWLLYVVGYSNRLAPPEKPVPQVQASGLVEAMAGLFARRLPAVTVGRGLLRHFFNEVRVRHKLAPTGDPSWEILAADPGVRGADLRALQNIARGLETGEKPDLRRLDDLLHNVRETMR